MKVTTKRRKIHHIYQRREKKCSFLRTSTATPAIKLCVLIKINGLPTNALSSKNCCNKKKERCIKNLVVPGAH